jgi:hypothetical protein
MGVGQDVRLAEISSNTYEVNRTDLKDALKDNRRAVLEASPSVSSVLTAGGGLIFQVQSPVADGVIGPRGFQVWSSNLPERLRLPCGGGEPAAPVPGALSGDCPAIRVKE